MRAFRPLVAALAIAAAPGPAGGADAAAPATPLELPRYDHAAAAIRLDGRLDEAAWQQPRLNRPLRLLRPDTLEPAPWATDFRVFYTEKGLYLSVDMEQPRETLLRRLTARDVLSVNRDYVSITIDTSGTGRYGYWMNLALGDNQIDGTILPERRYSSEWDGAWQGASRETERGWSAELFVPWSQLAMPRASGQRRIGIYMSRKVGQLNQSWGWPALPSSGAVFLSAFQPLLLEDVDPRRQWSAFPAVSYSRDRAGDAARTRAGLDLFWRESSNLQLMATLNPDFGSAEADDVVVNLTADETFLPEKRLFFQEGQEIFTTSPRADPDGDEPLILVNTRRIGGRPRLPPDTDLPLRDRLRPVDLLAAAQLAGQVGPLRYGLLAAFEDDSGFASPSATFTQPGRDFSVARLLYEDERRGARRGLGAIATRVAHADGDANVAGLDGHLLSPGGRWQFDGQLLRSDTLRDGAGYGGFLDTTFTPRQGLAHTLRLTYLDERLDINDFGFQTRNDMRDLQYAVEWIESGFASVRDFTLTPSLRYQENADGRRTHARLQVSADILRHDLDRIVLAAAWLPAQYDDRNSFGNGTFAVHSRWHARAEYRSDTAAPLSLYGKLAWRDEALGGRTLETAASLAWRPLTNLGAELSIARLDRSGWLLHQENRDFTTFDAGQWQPGMSLEFFPSARQQLRLALQWVGVRARERGFYRLPDDSPELVAVGKPPGESDDFALSRLSVQLRYRWQIAPLSDLYAVYTRGDSRRSALADFESLFAESWRQPLSDLFVVKLRYRFGS